MLLVEDIDGTAEFHCCSPGREIAKTEGLSSRQAPGDQQKADRIH
jgi:hypothetical protein